MSHFAQAFWSTDYAGGLGILFGKLQQGVQENQQIMTIARMRADAEELYGQHLGDIMPATEKIADGFQKDDGASVRKAYEGVRVEMEEASRKHKKIAANIRELVVYPFGRWCDQHATRVQHSQDDLQGRVKGHDKQAESVRRLRSHYFNKCRLVEDLEEEDKLAFKEPQAEASQSPKALPPIVKVQEPESEDEPEPIEIGEQMYSPDQVKKILTHMLENIRLGETRVPILGTYQNTSTGTEIVEYVQKHMDTNSMALAERVGQDMIANGFLRLVGNVGSVFANSSRMHYQWRPKVFQITGLPEKTRPTTTTRIGTALSLDSIDSPLVGQVNEYLAAWNPLNNAHPNETPSVKLQRETREADDRYKAAVRKLDLLRCTLEEAIYEHLKFMEKCELDRLKAIKSVVLDFSGAISNVIPSLQSTVDKMMLFQETVQPLGDLRYLLENYRTGAYAPKVPIYENYYNSVDDQTFGIELEARAKADKKRVPLIITSILTYLDHHYPLLDGDEVRRGIWLVDIPIAATHRLRAEVNNGNPIPPEVFERYEVPVVANLLKIYLLELPDSIVSSSLYEIMKTIYSSPTTAEPSAAPARVSVLQNALGQLRIANIASLDAIMTHFARLIDLTSADEAYVVSLAQNLAPCILRPRTEGSITFEEKYNYRFLRDLLDHRSAIFSELKRASSMLSRSGTVVPGNVSNVIDNRRPRAISTDESNRRANMEERARAIANRSRASSPTPQPREKDAAGVQNMMLDSHVLRTRRDSSRGPETRFPVNVGASPRVVTLPGAAHTHRASLEVPGPSEVSPVRDRGRGHGRLDPGLADPAFTPATTVMTSMDSQPTFQNGSVAGMVESPTAVTTTIQQPQVPANAFNDIEKKNSLGRSAAAVGRFPRRPGSSGGDRGTGPFSGGLTRQRGAEKRESVIGGSLADFGSTPNYGATLGGFREVGIASGDFKEGGEGPGAAQERRPVGVELVDKPMDD